MCEHIVERDHAVRRVLAESTDVADWKQLRRHLHGDLGLCIRADAHAGEDRPGADATKRVGGVLPVPKQRQGRGDHAGAQDPEQRQHALHHVGQLQRHHRVGGKPEFAQPCGDCANRPVGLRISQPARGAVGEGRAVGRIGQRHRVGVTHAGAAEQLVERCGRAGDVAAAIENHGLPPGLAGASLRACHQVSGKYPNSEVCAGCSTRFQRATHCAGG